MSTGLDARVSFIAPDYAELGFADAHIVFGRGSEPFEGGRKLSESAEKRVFAIGAYLLAHETEVNEASDASKVAVLFSCGWAAGNGENEPDVHDREAELMFQFAEQIGLTEYFGDRVRFGVQANSYSTISDAIFARQIGFFGNRNKAKFDADRKIGVVSQNDHMGRCVDATRWAFRIRPSAILEISAPTVDDHAMQEKITRVLTNIGTIGSHSNREKLLRRDLQMISARVALQNMFTHGNVAETA